MKKIHILTIVALSFFSGCEKNVPVEDVFSNFRITPDTVPADGQSSFSISVQLPNKSDTDRRKVLFTASDGIFTGSGTNKYTATAAYDSGYLKATAVLRAGTKPGTIKITAQPEFNSPIQNYIISGSVTTTASAPFSIKLSPSLFGLSSNFLTEVTLTAQIRNSTGGFVSRGVHAIFEDEFLNGDSAYGRFREVQDMTTDSSTVTAIYSAGPYAIGTVIKIRSTIMDGTVKTGIKDSILLNLNQ